MPEEKRDIQPGIMNCINFEQITDVSSAVGFTAAKLAAGTGVPKPSRAYVQAEGDVIRYRMDGTNPTASVGHRLAINECVWIAVANLSNVKFIEENGSGKLNISYFE